ncbi:hypothetical protein [Burkholderia territorii]|uniref:hypothetical protein n=1 Tax=Burkholderia territorii TaxID=1503055 RepID=UPI0012D8B27A|nr:hypothetical protein [Burkholderia territorii]
MRRNKIPGVGATGRDAGKSDIEVRMTRQKQVALKLLQMIRTVITAVVGFFLTFCWATSGHAEQPTKEVKQIVVTTDGVQCPIRLVDPYNARVTETRYVLDHFPYRRTGIGELYLQFECVNSNDAEAIRNIVPASFDENGKQWKEDFSALSAEDVALLKPVTRIFPLEAANSTGIAVTQEQTNGDPKTRDRRFAFCLRRPPVMLCGGTPQIARPFYQKSDLLPFALTVVKSIEFIDAPDDGARAASAATPSPAVIPPQ